MFSSFETFKLMADEEAVHKGVKGVSGEEDKLIDWAIQSYNTSTSNSNFKVHGVAKTAVKTVLIQSPGFIETVRKAWMMTKVRESAITVDVLASPFLRALKMDNGLSENQFWKDMLTPTTLKNEWWVKRALGAWESRVSMAQEQSGTGFNLRSKPARPPEPTPPPHACANPCVLISLLASPSTATRRRRMSMPSVAFGPPLSPSSGSSWQSLPFSLRP